MKSVKLLITTKPRKMPDIQLDYDQTHKIGVLPDKSTVYIKRSYKQTDGEYSIIRRLDGNTDFNDMILEDGYITILAAVERAWYFFNMLNK